MLAILQRLSHNVHHYAQFPALFTEIVPSSNGHGGKKQVPFYHHPGHHVLLFRSETVPRNYYLYGFNTKDRREFKEYMDDADSPMLKRKLYETLWNLGHTSLVNNKYIFYGLCRHHKIPVPEIWGIYDNGKVTPDGRSLEQLMAEKDIKRAILKPVEGMQGQGIYFAFKNEDGLVLKPAIPAEGQPGPSFPPGEYIIQEIISQHPALDRVNPFCLNSIRIITVLSRDKKVKILAAMLRTSAGNFPIDNFSLGGIVVGIDLENGKLKRSGFIKGERICTMTHHPVTGVAFEDFRIPYWHDIKDLVIKAQETFSELRAIGWDIAVTPKGPVIIEGNLEWGTAGIQAANGGLLTPENRAIFAGYGLTFYD